MSRERSEQVMRRYLNEVVIAKNLEVIDEIAAEDMWDHTQSEPGRNGLVEHVRGFHRLIPNVEIEVSEIIADDCKVVGIWNWRGNPVTDFLGIPAGREVVAQVASLFRLRDGLLADYSLMVTARTTSEPMVQGGMANLID